MFDLTIEPLGDEIRESYLTLLPHQVANGFDFINWKFAATPDGPGLFSVARMDGEIVGLSAYLRLRFKLGDEVGVSYQAIDSIVSPRCQGQGLFTKLARKFSDEVGCQADLIWGFPNANAAPAWFGKLGWTRHGYAPFLIKPLRSGYILRRAGIAADFRISALRDRGASTVASLNSNVDELWDRFSADAGAAVVRDRDYLSWRLFSSPGRSYRVVMEQAGKGAALVASTVTGKHGGRIGYVMEALGAQPVLTEVLASEVGRMADDGAEVALAWCHPWSPNYKAYRKVGFVPLPPRLRPVEIHVGSRGYTVAAAAAGTSREWYLSYLDSDTN